MYSRSYYPQYDRYGRSLQWDIDRAALAAAYRAWIAAMTEAVLWALARRPQEPPEGTGPLTMGAFSRARQKRSERRVRRLQPWPRRKR